LLTVGVDVQQQQLCSKYGEPLCTHTHRKRKRWGREIKTDRQRHR